MEATERSGLEARVLELERALVAEREAQVRQLRVEKGLPVKRTG